MEREEVLVTRIRKPPSGYIREPAVNVERTTAHERRGMYQQLSSFPLEMWRLKGHDDESTTMGTNNLGKAMPQ